MVDSRSASSVLGTYVITAGDRVEERSMKRETLEYRLLKRIDRKRGDVFLRADFEDGPPMRTHRWDGVLT
jgi:hypothetical protein